MSIALGIIGGGVMGEALLSRLIQQQVYASTAILVSDRQEQRRQFLANTYRVQVTEDNRAVLAAEEAVLLAIKPQVFDKVVADLGDRVKQSRKSSKYPLVISILAGVPLSRLESAFPEHPVIRAMPNTPATVGAGITAIAPGTKAESHHVERAQSILEAVGEVVQVSESLLDAVTGLSGSGPGYTAIFVEALTDGGVAAGLPRAIATKLALATLRGTAALLQESGIHPAELKDRVTSPGGTTIAGIAELERFGFRAAIIEAVRAAAERSRSLGD